MFTKTMAPKLTISQITKILKLHSAGYHFAEIVACVGLDHSDEAQLAQLKKHLRSVK